MKDSTMQKLADKGNGHYAYIDTLNEARKVFVEQTGGTLITIAKDVKIQVEFNPGRVVAYRLIGYEKRLLRSEDFKDDHKDAGEIGAGHTVTAFYELVPVGKTINLPGIDPLKYQQPAKPTGAAAGPELLTIKLRYKEPEGEVSKVFEVPVTDEGKTVESASEDFRFAAAVVEFGLLLRESPYRGASSWADVHRLASGACGYDPNGHRAEFLHLARVAEKLALRD